MTRGFREYKWKKFFRQGAESKGVSKRWDIFGTKMGQNCPGWTELSQGNYSGG